MDSRELVTRTLKHEPVDRVPRDLWAISGVVRFRRDEYDRLLETYPMDMTKGGWPYGLSKRATHMQGDTGTHVDPWGSVWHIGQPGVAGEVKEWPIKEWSDLDEYQIPWELLDDADFSAVNPRCAETDKFVRGGTQTRPWERLQFLRGTENAMMDLAYGEKEVHSLLQMLHDFSCREWTEWAKTDVDAISFMDDWGSQNSLLISPEMWRDVFKPMYKEYCDIAHAAGKFVFMHSDGHIADIYQDIIEIGVDAINSQLFCMDIEDIAEKYRGKITFYGEIDRQSVLPFGSPDEAREAVRRVRKALDRGQGGVIAQCEWGLNDPYENIAAVYDEWSNARPV